jgi:hypothetical protein
MSNTYYDENIDRGEEVKKYILADSGVVYMLKFMHDMNIITGASFLECLEHGTASEIYTEF